MFDLLRPVIDLCPARQIEKLNWGPVCTCIMLCILQNGRNTVFNILCTYLYELIEKNKHAHTICVLFRYNIILLVISYSPNMGNTREANSLKMVLCSWYNKYSIQKIEIVATYVTFNISYCIVGHRGLIVRNYSFRD